MYAVSFLLYPPLSATEVERMHAGEVKMNVPAPTVGNLTPNVQSAPRHD